MNHRMERLAPWARVAYGVDCCGESATAVRAIRRRGGHLAFEPADVAGATREADRAAIACAMPPGPAMAIWLRTPMTSRFKARRTLPTLLDMAMPFPLDECLCAFTDPVRAGGVGGKTAAAPLRADADGERGGGMAALAVAARKSDIAQRLAALSAQGIDPHTLDHEGLALWTQARREHPPAADGQARVRLVVHVRGREAVAAIGAGDVFWSAHRIVNGPDGTLERTVRVQLDTAAGGRYAKAPTTWIWSGSDPDGCAAWRVRAEAALPGESVTVNDPVRFLARALATRALTDGQLRFNLRRGSFAHPGAEQRMSAALYRRAAALALLAAVLMAVNAGVALRRAGDEREAEARFTRRITQVAGWPVTARGENAILIARRELEARQAAFAPLKRSFEPSLLETLDAALDAASQAQAAITTILLRHGNIGLRGDAPSRAAAEALKGRLEALGYAPALTADDAPDGRTGFTLEGERRELQP